MSYDNDDNDDHDQDKNEHDEYDDDDDDNAIIESGSEEKRKVIRGVKQQVEQLCCKLPFAISQINAFLEPHKAQIFS